MKFRNTPIWVNLPNLLHKYWSKEIISKVGSTVGTQVSGYYSFSLEEALVITWVVVGHDITYPLMEHLDKNKDKMVKEELRVYYLAKLSACDKCRN